MHVVSPFVGGAFGSSLRPNYYPALTAMAARELKRPVKVVYTRTQMFTRPRLPPVHDPEGRARRGAVGEALRDDPRGRAQHLQLRGVLGRHHGFHAPGLRLPEPLRAAEDYRHGPQHADLDARAGSRQRHVRARMRDGRAGLRAQDRSAGAAPHQLRRGGPRERQAVFEQGAAGVLPARSGEVRVEGPQVRAPLDARRAAGWSAGGWPPASGALSRCPPPPESRSQRRHGARRQRDERHRPRDLHGHHHDRRRVPGAEARAGEVRARRHEVPAGAVAGGLLDDGERRLGRARRGPGRRREAAGAREPGSELAAEGGCRLRRGDARRPPATQKRPVAFRQRLRSHEAQRPRPRSPRRSRRAPRRSARSTRRWRTARSSSR